MKIPKHFSIVTQVTHSLLQAVFLHYVRAIQGKKQFLKSTPINVMLRQFSSARYLPHDKHSNLEGLN